MLALHVASAGTFPSGAAPTSSGAVADTDSWTTPTTQAESDPEEFAVATARVGENLLRHEYALLHASADSAYVTTSGSANSTSILARELLSSSTFGPAGDACLVLSAAETARSGSSGSCPSVFLTDPTPALELPFPSRLPPRTDPPPSALP